MSMALIDGKHTTTYVDANKAPRTDTFRGIVCITVYRTYIRPSQCLCNLGGTLRCLKSCNRSNPATNVAIQQYQYVAYV